LPDTPAPEPEPPRTALRRRSRGGRGENEETRRRLLSAAREEFARAGLMGARVDVIAQRAEVNKQLIYYHFGDKTGLYTAVLEEAYLDIRQRESELDLDAQDSEGAMRRLVGFTIDYLVQNPEFVALLTDENMHRAVHIQDSRILVDLRPRFVGLIAKTLARGAEEGVFRTGIDPEEFYISIAGMTFFYVSNIHTLSVLFGRDLQDPEAIARRRAHILDFVFAALRP
jgi:TetR/AcrR family transcriptional regulator